MNDERIESFVRDEYGRVVRAVAVVCGDVGRAEDAVQEALLASWETPTEIDRFDAWVVTVALNRSRSFLRRIGTERSALARLGRRREASEDTYGPAVDADPAVTTALRALPPRQRQVAVLHYYLDLAVADVAAALGISEGTVKTCLHRARTALRDRLEREPDEEVGHGRR